MYLSPTTAPHSSGTGVRSRRVGLLFSTLLTTGCLTVTAAERPPIDCSIERPDNTLQRCPAVRYASEFGQCIRASDFDQHSCLVLDTDATFCSDSQDLPLTVVLDRSNVTLDCANQSIDHGWSLPLPDSAPATADTVTAFDARFPGIHALTDRSLDNIQIRNCTIRRTGHSGINLSRFFGGQLPESGLPQGHSNIDIENTRIEQTITAVFVGTYSHNITLDRLIIDHTQRIAVYTEAGSHGVTIKDSVIANNQTREALALDSTYDSEVLNTLFVNNREGAINVYQNCGELKGIVCPVIRSTAPNNNLIENNRFVFNGDTDLQIASRQGRRHSQGWCATLDGQAGQHRDTAENNVVRGNTFVCNSGIAMRIMDGPNQVTDNRVLADRHCVPLEISTGGLGRDERELLDGLVVENNDLQGRRAPRLRNLSDGVIYRP